MKNTTIALVAILLMCGMTSCQKDGVFNPNKKIERVYASYTYSSEEYYNGAWHSSSSSETPKYLEAMYNWDGSKLKSIDYYSSNGGIYMTANYTYDGRKVSRIDDYQGNDYMTFEYKWGKLTKADCFEGGALECTYIFTHKGNKISKIDITYLGKKKGSALNSKFLQNAIFTVLQDKVVSKDLCEQLCSSNAKGVETETIELTWKGNNISELTYTSGSFRETCTYTYDKKRNPFYGLWILDDDPSFENMSKNNVLSVNWVVPGEGNITGNSTYTYDGNWPTMQTYTSSSSYQDYRSTSTYYEYYEYKN